MLLAAALRRAKGNLARVMATLQAKGVRPLVVLPEALLRLLLDRVA
ncbi:hypothetical protein [Pseudomonas oryzihabitans]